MVTRSDLTAGYQIAQTAHGVAAFAFSRPLHFKDWHEYSQYVVALQVTSEDNLNSLYKKAKAHGLDPIAFREPDLDNSLTAISFTPNNLNKDFLKGLQLAGKQFGELNKNSHRKGVSK